MEVKGKIIKIKLASRDKPSEEQKMLVTIEVPRRGCLEDDDQMGYFYLHCGWCTISQNDDGLKQTLGENDASHI